MLLLACACLDFMFTHGLSVQVATGVLGRVHGLVGRETSNASDLQLQGDTWDIFHLFCSKFNVLDAVNVRSDGAADPCGSGDTSGGAGSGSRSYGEALVAFVKHDKHRTFLLSNVAARVLDLLRGVVSDNAVVTAINRLVGKLPGPTSLPLGRQLLRIAERGADRPSAISSSQSRVRYKLLRRDSALNRADSTSQALELLVQHLSIVMRRARLSNLPKWLNTPHMLAQLLDSVLRLPVTGGVMHTCPAWALFENSSDGLHF